MQQHKINYFTVYSNDESGDHKGFLDSAARDKFLSSLKNDWHQANYYFCGPAAFMSAKKMLVKKGVEEGALHYEVFGPTVAI